MLQKLKPKPNKHTTRTSTHPKQAPHRVKMIYDTNNPKFVRICTEQRMKITKRSKRQRQKMKKTVKKNEQLKYNSGTGKWPLAVEKLHIIIRPKTEQS